MRLTKEREAEIRRRKLQREGESKTYLDPDIQLLFAEIDYLRDSFLDMAVVMNALTEERDQLKSKLDIAIEAISIQVLANRRMSGALDDDAPRDSFGPCGRFLSDKEKEEYKSRVTAHDPSLKDCCHCPVSGEK